jgi:hypothetical protein
METHGVSNARQIAATFNAWKPVWSQVPFHFSSFRAKQQQQQQQQQHLKGRAGASIESFETTQVVTLETHCCRFILVFHELIVLTKRRGALCAA